MMLATKVRTTSIPSRKKGTTSLSSCKDAPWNGEARPVVVHPDTLAQQHPGVPDEARAAILREYVASQSGERERLRAWLEAFAGFNQNDSLGNDYRSEIVVTHGKDSKGRTVSGFPCQPLPRVEKKVVERPNGSKGIEKTTANKVRAVYLEEGDHWGPHNTGLASYRTREKYEQIDSESVKSRSKSQTPLRPVSKDVGRYTGKPWTAAMSKEMLVQGFEDWPRPPTLVDILLQHTNQMAKCPTYRTQHVFRAQLEDAAGNPYSKTRVAPDMWEVRDGSILGPTVYDDVSDQTEQSSAKVEEVASAFVGPLPEKRYFDDGTSITSLSDYGTPISDLDQKLETGSEVVSFKSVSFKDEGAIRTPFKFVLKDGLDSSVINPPKSARYQQSEDYWDQVANARWSCSSVVSRTNRLHRLNDRVRYVLWLMEHDVHNRGLNRPLIGAHYETLLFKTLGFGGLMTMRGRPEYGLLEDDERYDVYFDEFGDRQLARERLCLHQVDPRQRVIEFDPLDEIEILPLDYEGADKSPPITVEQMEKFFKVVEQAFNGMQNEMALMRESIKRIEIAQRLETIEAPPPSKDFEKGFKVSTAGLYVPADKVILPKKQDYLSSQINEGAEESIDLNSDLFRDFAEEIARRNASRDESHFSVMEELKKAWNLFSRKSKGESDKSIAD